MTEPHRSANWDSAPPVPYEEFAVAGFSTRPVARPREQEQTVDKPPWYRSVKKYRLKASIGGLFAIGRKAKVSPDEHVQDWRPA